MSIGAAHLPVHIIDTGEEAARQAMSAAAPPPARPARSTARAQRPPIPPPSTCPRVDTRSDDARMEVHARDATWQERLPARSPPPPTRPPPRPARAAARQPTRPTRHEHPSKEPAYAMSAHAPSSGEADRTAPTNDRPFVSSTSTATAPRARPLPFTAASSLSQRLPSTPTRLYGPRTPPTNPNRHVSRTDPGDVLQDAAYLQAIADYVEEGGGERSSQRKEGEEALARSVRGAHSDPGEGYLESDRHRNAQRARLSVASSTPSQKDGRAAARALGAGQHCEQGDNGEARRPYDHDDPVSPPTLHRRAAATATSVLLPPTFKVSSVKASDVDASFTLDPISRLRTSPSSKAIDRAPLGLDNQDPARGGERAVRYHLILPIYNHRSVDLAPSRTREGDHQIAPATSTTLLPSPPRSRPALSKHPTPTLRPAPFDVPLHSTQLTARDWHASTQATRIEAGTIHSSGMHNTTGSRLSMPLAPPTAHAHSVAMAQDVPDSHAEYTSVGNARLARAPVAPPSRRAEGDHHRQERGRSHPAHGDFAHAGAVLNMPNASLPSLSSARGHSYEQPPPRGQQTAYFASPAHFASLAHSTPLYNDSPTQQVHIHATKHPPLPNLAASSSRACPMPPLPPPSYNSPLHAPPPPPGWPFPLSVEEMGWVLAAVVMARNMDREEERRRHEYDDSDHYSIWEPNDEDESGGDLSSHDNSAVPPGPASHATLSEGDNTETTTYDVGYDNTIAGLTSPVPSLATSITDPNRDSVDTQDWDETSALSTNETGEFFDDYEEYEQGSDGQVSDEP
ncbi:hypothetical protein EV122DRAFT_285362 [Schizophyllum commune]